MSTTTKTTYARFQAYLNEADESVRVRVREDGLESPMAEWLMAEPARKLYLDDAMATAAHSMLRAANDHQREHAAMTMVNWFHSKIAVYVNAWSDEMREAFMAQIDDEAAESKRLDLAEGIDD